MLKQEKLPSINSTKPGAHYNFAKNQENKHTPHDVTVSCIQYITSNYHQIWRPILYCLGVYEQTSVANNVLVNDWTSELAIIDSNEGNLSNFGLKRYKASRNLDIHNVLVF